MEEHKVTNHLLSLENRRNLVATGILDVDRFDEKSVVVVTNMGVLAVEGEDLHINRLSVEAGEIHIEGTINRFYYADIKEKNGVFKGLFR